MKSSRVIFVNRFYAPDISATSRMLEGIASGLAENGARVTVVTGCSDYRDSNYLYPDNETISGVEVFRVARSRFSRQNYFGRVVDIGWFYLCAWKALMSLVSEGDVLVCKSDPPLLVVPGALVKWRKKCKLVSWNQDLFPEIARELFNFPVAGAVYAVLMKLRNRALDRCDQCVVAGRAMQETLQAHTRVPVSVISNWSPRLEPDASQVTTLKKNWGLDGRFVAGYSGNLGYVHEFQTILEVIERLRKNRSIVFLFTGGGKYHQKLSEYAARQGLDNVVLKPYQPQEKLADTLGVADIHLVSLKPGMESLVLPSKFYGICAASKPLLFIGNKNSEIARMVESHDCGYSFQAGQAGEIASTIKSLPEIPADLENKGAHARELFEQNHTLENAVQKWHVLLLQLSNSPEN